MKTLIVWTGKSGATEEIADRLASAIGGETVTARLGKGKAPDPSEFDRVIAGGAVYAGGVDKKLKTFCEEHMQSLLARPLGLFLCSLKGDDTREKMERSFPALLLEHATVKEWLGGRFIFGDHNFFIRAMMKKIMESSEDVDNIRHEAIAAFAAAMNGNGGVR